MWYAVWEGPTGLATCMVSTDALGRASALISVEPRAPALTVVPIGIPARFPSGFAKLDRRSESEAGKRGEIGRRMSQDTRRLLKSGGRGRTPKFDWESGG